MSGEALLRNSALVARSAGHYHEAVDFLKKSLEFNDSSLSTLVMLGLTYVDMREHDDALEALNLALELDPDSHEVHTYLGYAYNGKKEQDKAKASLERALELKADFPEAHYKLGNVYHETRNFPQAEQYYRKTIELKPRFESAHNDLGVLLQEMNRFDESVESLNKALEIQPDYVAAFLNLGVTLTRQGKHEEAVDCYKRALKRFPKYPLAYHNLGNALRDMGRIAESLQYYRTAIKLKPEFGMAYTNMALAFQKQGKLEEAIKSCKKSIEVEPEYSNAYSLLVELYMQTGEAEKADEIRGEFAGQQPNPAAAHYAMANQMHAQGRLEDAVSSYKKALEINPDFVAALNDIGAAYRQLGQLDEAFSYLNKALALDPGYAAAHLNIGVAYSDSGDKKEAVNCYHRALEINPNFAPALHNLGNELVASGKLEEGIEQYRKALEKSPDMTSVWLSLGFAYSKMKGKQEEAIAAYKKAIELNVNYAEAYLNLGVEYHEKGALKDAVTAYKRAIEVRPDYAEPYNNLGFVLNELGEYEEAVEVLTKAIELKSNYGDGHLNLAYSLYKMDRFDEAITSALTAVELNPKSAINHKTLGVLKSDVGDLDGSISHYKKELELRASAINARPQVKELGELLIELKRIPILYQDESQIRACRSHIFETIKKASNMVSVVENLSEQERAILKGILFNTSNFYLAYQQDNDIEFHRAYARLATAILGPEIEPYLKRSSKAKTGGKIRVGLASTYLSSHHGSFWAYNWLKQLPGSDYEFYLYSINGVEDEITRMFARLGTYKWLPFNENNYVQSCESLTEDELDILFLPDIGMSGTSIILSLMRFAPVQCVGWGHPVTSGSDNIDFYLGSELMETEKSDEHYHEKLVRMPNFGLYFDEEKPPEEIPTRAEFNLPEGRTIYGSVQSLFKYLPQFDYIYPAIARAVPDAFFVFAGNKSTHVNAIFEERLKRAFEKEGLEYSNYVKLLPRMKFNVFMRLLSSLDVNLDTIGWNGGITTMRALAMNVPTVTTPTEFMRGRHSYSMLKAIGMEELITPSLDDYVALASKLGLDAGYRKSLVEKVKATKHKLFYDRAPMEFLDAFFKAETKKAQGPSAINK